MTAKLLPVDLDIYEEYAKANPAPEFILPGLPRGDIGMLIAPPDSGKSMLCLTIAYELATGRSLLGIANEASTPRRTLYWPSEDGVHQAFSRITQHLGAFNKHEQKQIAKNVTVRSSSEAIVAPGRSKDGSERESARVARDELIEEAKQYDLLIIDTIREAIGLADEVEDDIRIKAALQLIGREAGVAVLVVHHPTKNVVRGLESVSTASASGLSRTIAKSRCHLYIQMKQDPKGKRPSTEYQLLQTKANFLPARQRLNIDLQFNEFLLLIAKDADLSLATEDQSTALTQPSESTESIAAEQPEYRPEPRKKPRTISVDPELFTEESERRAQDSKQDQMKVREELIEKLLMKKERARKASINTGSDQKR